MDFEVWELFHPSIAPHDGDLHAYLSRVLEKCFYIFEATGASIFLEDGKDVYRLFGQLGIEPPIPSDASVRMGEGIAGACLELGEPLLIHDVQSQIVFSGKAIQPRRHLGSAMVVPLIIANGPIIGVLNVSKKSGEGDFSQPDLAKASSLAHQVALAIYTGRLMAEMKQANELMNGLMECIPGAVFSVRADGSVQNANLKARQLRQSRPEWYQNGFEIGRSRVTDQTTGERWRVECVPAGEGKLVFAENVTDETNKADEEQRLRRLAEIGQMAATVAHEIRNPLTGIRAAVQLLVDDPEKGSELGEIVDQEVMRLSALCEEFLDLARPASIKLEPTRLSTLLNQILKLERPVAELAGVQLVVEGPDKSSQCPMDKNRVQQVMRNLLRNAIQACQKGDTVTVRYGGDWFEVEDTGCGMTMATLQNLFVPFYTTKIRGTGLGLSSAKKIVEAHGGDMSVKTELGKGTTFKVHLGRVA